MEIKSIKEEMEIDQEILIKYGGTKEKRNYPVISQKFRTI